MIFKKVHIPLLSIVIALYGCHANNTASTGVSSAKASDSVGTAPIDSSKCVCAGMLQSPINIVDRTAIPVALPALIFEGKLTKMYIQNDHKAIKVAPIDTVDSANYVMFNYKRYCLVDFHFHHKSEHLFDGKRDSMEVHIVYQNRHSKAYVVVGMLISMGENPNKILSAIWDEFPPENNYDKKNLAAPVNITNLIRYTKADPYYSYVGSLTTPGYDEGVAWVVLKKKLVLDSAQIVKFGLYYYNNAREPYPVNNRLILVNGLSDK